MFTKIVRKCRDRASANRASKVNTQMHTAHLLNLNINIKLQRFYQKHLKFILKRKRTCNVLLIFKFGYKICQDLVRITLVRLKSIYIPVLYEMDVTYTDTVIYKTDHVYVGFMNTV